MEDDKISLALDGTGITREAEGFDKMDRAIFDFIEDINDADAETLAKATCISVSYWGAQANVKFPEEFATAIKKLGDVRMEFDFNS